jgi:AcrR family transcriptional regulator
MQLVTDILTAATQVLIRDGARRFTTARVAEKAGVSVGSLYQYFPNKEAILFRLQTDEWQQTSTLLAGILSDTTRPPLDRLRTVVHEFVRTECEEIEMRVALGNAAALYRNAPEIQKLRLSFTKTVSRFMREVLPTVSKDKLLLASDVIMMSLSAVGEQVSEAGYTPDKIDAYACSMADMFTAYIGTLSAHPAD